MKWAIVGGAVVGGGPLAGGGGTSGWREMLRRWTPRKMMIKPTRREMVLVASVVLKPWKRIVDATMVQVVNPT